MTKKNISIIAVITFMMFWLPVLGISEDTNLQKPKSAAPPSVEEVLETLGNRFNAADFSANFSQESVLKALNIIDTAKGKAWFKHPGMMRWQYETPEKYAIITDGKTLWIYRPEDNQVMVGNAMTYFSNGKGASFLSNFKLVKETFKVSFAKPEDDAHYTLKLIPNKKQLEVSEILLNVDRQSFDIDSVVSINAYGDETRIRFSNLSFEPNMDVSLFNFTPPKGADVVEMDAGN